MRLTILLTALLFIRCSPSEKDRKDWTILDHLNKDVEYPFTPEHDISGQCFIVLPDTFNYNRNPIVINADGKEVVRIEVSDSTVITTFHGQAQASSSDRENPFNPWLFGDNPDYFRLAFECVDTIGAYYKVKLNDHEFVLIDKTNPDFKKESIKDFVTHWTEYGFDFDRSSNPIRETPADDAKIINHTSEKEYKIWSGDRLDVQGDWINLKTIEEETGWVKWRDGNKILIRMYYDA